MEEDRGLKQQEHRGRQDMLLGARDETTMLPAETPQSTINLGALVHLPSWQLGLKQLQGPSSFWFPFLRKVGAGLQETNP